MRFPRSLAVTLAATLSVSACTDTPTAPTPPREAEPPAPAGPAVAGRAGATITETPVLVRYLLDVSVRGPLVPGRPFDVVVQTTNTIDDRQANVQVVLPEVAVARLNGWRDGKAAVGSRVPSHLSATHALSRGLPAADHTSIVIGAPGLYRLIVRASSPEGTPVSLGRSYVQDVTTRTLWLVVDARGGRVLDRFEASAIPPNMVREAGPSRVVTMRIVCPIDDPTACDAPPPPPVPNPVVRAAYPIVATYNNIADGGGPAEPLRNAQVTVSDYPSGASYAGQTDDNGRFFASCVVNGSSQQHIVVRLKTPDQFHVQDHVDDEAGMAVVDVVEPAGFCAGGGATHVEVSATEDGPAWMHQQLLATVAPSRSLFQLGRGDVAVNFDRTNFELTSAYYVDMDEIFIKRDHMYGSYGRFVMSHEYGHALAEKSMSGARPGGCGSPHYLDGAYSMVCALSEGWADYHAALVRGPAIGGYYTGIRDNWWYPGGDGSLIEGAFASFLMSATTTESLVRSASGVDYALHYPPSFVAASIRDCRAYYPWSSISFRVTNYADEVVWCLSGGIDQSVYGTYFTSRPFQHLGSIGYLGGISNPTPFPANFSTANVRRNWLARLYGQY